MKPVTAVDGFRRPLTVAEFNETAPKWEPLTEDDLRTAYWQQKRTRAAAVPALPQGEPFKAPALSRRAAKRRARREGKRS